MNLDLFDEEIGSMLDRGSNRAAIEESKKVAAHAMTAAAGIYLRLAEKGSALKLMKLAVEMQPENPVYYSNVVCLLCQMNCDKEAETYSRKGILLPDAGADMFYNHGLVCKNLHCINMPSSNELLLEAASAFRKSCELAPDKSAWTYGQLANILLPLGFYEEGLRADEWRFKCMPYSQWIRRRYKKPFWDGKTDLHGKKILVFNEQGHGDGIQYSRYIPKLKEAGACVILEVKPDVRGLYVNAPYVDCLVDFKENGPFEFPEHDFIISIVSLPCMFDAALNNIPMQVPYISPNKVSISEADSLIKGKFKVGIIWAGNFQHTSDRDRSCFLRYFEPIFNIPGVNIFSLQKGNMVRSWRLERTMSQGDEDYDVVDLMDGSEHLKYVDLAPTIKDFNDTALVLQKLDLLICVDTAAGHLAGAMGLPVWMLIPNAHEWRWKKSWYPNMRVFKQPAVGDWKGLLENVAGELQKCIDSNHSKADRVGSDQ